uniref:Uncharacterized protein n=1 Tax=Rhizophora mucronata TaxID=61149 RepID=A0A2P2Q6E6_RHIMU
MRILFSCICIIKAYIFWFQEREKLVCIYLLLYRIETEFSSCCLDVFILTGIVFEARVQGSVITERTMPKENLL